VNFPSPVVLLTWSSVGAFRPLRRVASRSHRSGTASIGPFLRPWVVGDGDCVLRSVECRRSIGHVGLDGSGDEVV